MTISAGRQILSERPLCVDPSHHRASADHVLDLDDPISAMPAWGPLVR